VRKTVFIPGRRLTWATWPSTQTAPSRSTQPAIAFAICRTGAGDSGEVSRAMAARLGDGEDISRLTVMTTDMGMPPILSPDEAEKAVLLAAPRGYCAGVDRAVITVEKALDLYGAPVYVRKQIVHNKHVVSDLESRGAIFVEELDEVPAGQTVVFSAHGVSPEVHRQAGQRELKTIDATCPLVTKVHHEARRFADDDYDILLIGHEGHEEVEGTAGEAPDHIQLVQSPADVPGIVVRDPARVAWLSQTTLSVDETLETVAAIRERFPLLLDPPSDDICYATQNRQLAVKEISSEADLVIVVGSGNSSNSVRLVEVALEAGAKSSYRVDDASEIDESWLDGVKTVSVTSGASVPENLVEGVLAYLAERGYPDAKAVHSAEESLIFALPKELRRDLKAAGRS
jgi:4-hydroxy-3-methylbut-2-enyl diphosphate reductase